MNLIQFFQGIRANLIKVDNQECERALKLEQKKYQENEVNFVEGKFYELRPPESFLKQVQRKDIKQPH